MTLLDVQLTTAIKTKTLTKPNGEYNTGKWIDQKRIGRNTNFEEILIAFFNEKKTQTNKKKRLT